MRLFKAIFASVGFVVVFLLVFGLVIQLAVGIPGPDGIGGFVLVLCGLISGKPAFTLGMLVWETHKLKG